MLHVLNSFYLIIFVYINICIMTENDKCYDKINQYAIKLRDCICICNVLEE